MSSFQEVLPINPNHPIYHWWSQFFHHSKKSPPPISRTLACAGCELEYTAEGLSIGQLHIGCLASPRGRFGPRKAPPQKVYVNGFKAVTSTAAR